MSNENLKSRSQMRRVAATHPNYLIEEIERLREQKRILFEENGRLLADKERLMAELSGVSGQLEKAEEVIRFYGDTANWDCANGTCHDMVPKGMNKPQKLWRVLELGERARAYFGKKDGE